MACALHPAPEATEGAAPPTWARPGPRPMTRCECADVPFQEIARQMAREGTSLEEVRERTGCGFTCTACVRDLQRFLASL